MRRFRRRSSTVRSTKPKMFWYTPGDVNRGDTWNTVGTLGVTTVFLPLAVVPTDAAVNLELGSVAPQNDRCTVHAIRGQISFFNAGATTQSAGLVRVGIIVDKIAASTSMGEMQPGAVGFFPELSGISGAFNPMTAGPWSRLANRSWMYLDQRVIPAQSIDTAGHGTTIDVHVKTKRVLLQGDALWLVMWQNVTNAAGTPDVRHVTNLRTLLSLRK